MDKLTQKTLDPERYSGPQWNHTRPRHETQYTQLTHPQRTARNPRQSSLPYNRTI